MTPPEGAVLRHQVGGRLAVAVWATGVLAYGTAVFHRFSLAVASIDAAERFGIGASTLALFSVMQVGIYAGMQVPVGVLLDRFGSKRLLFVGAALMASGQLVFALADGVASAVVARVLLGLGDAMTFISVLRIVALWFPPRRNPLLVQATGLLGQLGAVAAAVPLVAVLHGAGWTATFTGAACLGGVVALLVAAVVRDSPWTVPDEAREAPRLTDVRRRLGEAWAAPGTRLGLWTHVVTLFPMMTFALLWGYPFLVQGHGLAPSTAGVLLTVLTVAGMAAGPALGALVTWHPFHRSRLVITVVGATAAAWTVVLVWPGAPLWLLVVLVLVMATNGPASMIGFDYARSSNPPHRLGSAIGIVNVGGFSACLVTTLLVGAALDALNPGSSGSYSPASFRWAFTVQYALWAFGLVQVLRYRRRARRDLAVRDPHAYEALRRGVVVVPTHA